MDLAGELEKYLMKKPSKITKLLPNIDIYMLWDNLMPTENKVKEIKTFEGIADILSIGKSLVYLIPKNESPCNIRKCMNNLYIIYSTYTEVCKVISEFIVYDTFADILIKIFVDDIRLKEIEFTINNNLILVPNILYGKIF